jgi:hypothetical protein
MPPSHAIRQQTMRWIKAGCFEAMAHDLRAILRLAMDQAEQPSAPIYDSRLHHHNVTYAHKNGTSVIRNI